MTVKTDDVQIRADNLSILHDHRVEVATAVFPRFIHPIAIFTGNEQQRISLFLHGEVIQMVRRTHDFLPLFLRYIKQVEYSFFGTVPDLVEHILIPQQYRTPVIAQHVFFIIGTTFIHFLLCLQVDNLQQAVIIEQHQLILIIYIKILQIQVTPDFLCLLALHIVETILSQQPHDMIIIDKDILNRFFHTELTEFVFDGVHEGFSRQVHTRHVVLVFQPKMVVFVKILVIVA